MEKKTVLHETEGFSTLLFLAFSTAAPHGGNSPHAATQHGKGQGITLYMEERLQRNGDAIPRQKAQGVLLGFNLV